MIRLDHEGLAQSALLAGDVPMQLSHPFSMAFAQIINPPLQFTTFYELRGDDGMTLLTFPLLCYEGFQLVLLADAGLATGKAVKDSLHA